MLLGSIFLPDGKLSYRVVFSYRVVSGSIFLPGRGSKWRAKRVGTVRAGEHAACQVPFTLDF